MGRVSLRRFSDLVPAPWKNGGGVTREIAVHPDGAGMESFGWRLSIATVASDGPFSVFPGIDRTLTVLDGAGLRLEVAGRSAELSTESPPHAFPADLPTSADLLGGEVTDLNVMTRRNAFRHRVARRAGPAEIPAAPDEAVWIVALDAAVRLRVGTEAESLGLWDAARLAAGATLEAGTILEIRIAPA